MRLRVVAILALVLNSGCTSEMMDLALASAANLNSAMSPGGTEMLLFGGRGHETFLGCLSCSEYEGDSLFNEYGDHGSRYGSESIFNPYSDFGSRYSDYSACNPYASDPPVIVDPEGGYYGRLTMNQNHPDVATAPELIGWLRGICQS